MVLKLMTSFFFTPVGPTTAGLTVIVVAVTAVTVAPAEIAPAVVVSATDMPTAAPVVEAKVKTVPPPAVAALVLMVREVGLTVRAGFPPERNRHPGSTSGSSRRQGCCGRSPKSSGSYATP
jgi:hypothetical protein